ncbi:hypothetical protein Btru_018981 [Bulinus truncatus]|nr:hypothetical protein Btru_018981 [Bulinus truncatus]
MEMEVDGDGGKWRGRYMEREVDGDGGTWRGRKMEMEGTAEGRDRGGGQIKKKRFPLARYDQVKGGALGKTDKVWKRGANGFCLSVYVMAKNKTTRERDSERESQLSQGNVPLSRSGLQVGHRNTTCLQVGHGHSTGLQVCHKNTTGLQVGHGNSTGLQLGHGNSTGLQIPRGYRSINDVIQMVITSLEMVNDFHGTAGVQWCSRDSWCSMVTQEVQSKVLNQTNN